MKGSHDVPEPVAGSILQEWLSGNVWQSKPIENRDRSLRCCLIQQWEIRDKRSAIADAIVNRRSNLTPYRRPILTPLSGVF